MRTLVFLSVLRSGLPGWLARVACSEAKASNYLVLSRVRGAVAVVALAGRCGLSGAENARRNRGREKQRTWS